MGAHAVRIERVVDAPIDDVWLVVTDIDRIATTLSSVVRLERVTEGPYAVGQRWRETRRSLGREETHDMWVSECEPPTKTVVASQSGSVDYRTTFELSSTESGATMVRLTFGALNGSPNVIQRMLWAAFGRIGALFTEASLRQDLAEIADAAERRAR